MRIALVSRFPRQINQPRGGVETATVGLLRALRSQGPCDLHVVTLESGLERPVDEHQEGIEIHRLPRSPWPMVLDILGGPSSRRLEACLSGLAPDIVHFHESWGLGGHARYPKVFTVHGFDSLNLPTERSRAWYLRAGIWRLMEAYGLRRQNEIISIAPYVTRMLRPQTSATITEIWNTLDPRYFAIERNEREGKILFLGWINPRKNPLILVEAAARLMSRFPDCRIYLYGEESDKAYSSLVRNRISETRTGKHIVLAGRISQSEIRKHLGDACLLVLPSLQENAPMVIAEAMAAGVPVIASNLCGIPDMVDDGETGFLVDPNDAVMISERIARLLNDGALRRRMGQRAREVATVRFHPDSVARATIDVYRRVIADFKRARRPVQAD